MSVEGDTCVLLGVKGLNFQCYDSKGSFKNIYFINLGEANEDDNFV